MPQIYREIDFVDVMKVLTHQGYRQHVTRAFALQLTRPDPDPRNRFRSTGEARRILMHGIPADQLRQVLRYSETPEEAAAELLALSTGKKLEPSGPRQNQGPQIDTEAMRQMIANAAGNEVAKATEQMAQVVAEQQKRIEELTAKLEKSAVAPKPKGKPGRPKKNAPKPADEEPELGPEEQAEYDRIMANLGTRAE